MKGKLIAAALLAVFPAAAMASETCPQTAKENWLRPEEIQVRMEAQGFEVKRVKREGSCYEVRAKNREGKRVEAYVSPADGAIVKEKVKS